MPKKFTTVYIDDSSIRLLVTKGAIVKNVAEVSLKPGWIDSLIINDPEKFTGRLAQLIDKQKLPTRKVTLGVSAVNCLTRQLTLPPLPKNMLEEAVVREAGRLLPLPMDELYLSWQVIQSTEEKVSVIVVALRRSIVDPLMASFKMAGLKIQNLTVKPLVLARLIKEKRAIIVDVQACDFDIVVISDGIPQPIRTVPFSSRELTWQEKSQLIIDEIDRTIKFYNTNNPTSPLDPNSDISMYVSGDLINQHKLRRLISDTFNFTIEALKPPQIFSPDVQPGYYLINYGLIIGQEEPNSGVNWLNLLPEVYQPNRVKWGRVVAIPATTVFAGVSLILLFLVTGAADNISAARTQLEASNSLLQTKQIEKQQVNREIKNLQDNLVSIKQSNDNCKKLLTILDTQAQKRNSDLTALLTNIPGSLTLTNINMGKEVVARGTAVSEVDVLYYATALERTGNFVQTVVSNIKTNEGINDYTITLIK